MNFYEFEKPLFPVYGIVGAADAQSAHQAYKRDISGKRSYAIPQMISEEHARKKYLAAIDPMGTRKKRSEVDKEFSELMNDYPVFLVVADQFV